VLRGRRADRLYIIGNYIYYKHGKVVVSEVDEDGFLYL